MTPEQLKASILQYAIQGKLVEQRLEEGTAEELFNEIQNEKNDLIKEKKIKKEKPQPELCDEDIPFDIPENWKWVRVGEMGSWASGATPSRTNPQFYGGTISWLKTGDLNDGYIEEVPEHITELALEKTSVRLNPEGSVLMAMYGATIGKLGILNKPMTTNQACCACIPFSGVFNKYLFYFLMSQRSSYIGMAEGGAQPNISKEKIVSSLMPLPPLEEQHRIVAKIEELLPYVDCYAESYEKLEQFNAKFPEDMKKSILQYAVQGKLVEQRLEEGTAEELYQQIQEEKQKLLNEGKIKKEKKLEDISDFDIPFDIPDSWKWIKVGELSSKVTDGEHKTPHRVKKFCGYYLLSARNVLNGSIRLDDVDYVDEEEYKRISMRCNPQEGDILLSCSGSVGRCTCIRDKNKYVMVRSAAMISPILIDSKYLMYAIQSECVQMQIREKTKQTAQANLFQAAIINLVIPVPPVKEQRRIVDKIEELLPFCEKL